MLRYLRLRLFQPDVVPPPFPPPAVAIGRQSGHLRLRQCDFAKLVLRCIYGVRGGVYGLYEGRRGATQKAPPLAGQSHMRDVSFADSIQPLKKFRAGFSQKFSRLLRSLRQLVIGWSVSLGCRNLRGEQGRGRG